jgi:putative ABC transport system permease protein
VIARIRAVPGVSAVAPRLDFDGMLSNGSESTMFLATAIDPSVEYSVCPKRATNLAKGSRLLVGDDPRAALIGRTLADSLGARPGSTLVMQAAGPRGGTNALDVSVSGFLSTNHPTASKRMATVTLGFAQELLRMKGQVTQYVVGVSDLDRVDGVARRAQAALGDGYQVTTWQEMDPGTRDRAKMMRYILLFVSVVLFFLVATGIINTTMMSVHERVREIGTMLAIGLRRRQIIALFLLEAMALGLASAMGGASAGYGIVRALARHGLQKRAPGGTDLNTYYPHVSGDFLVVVIAFTVLGTALAAVYPAWRASRLRPVEALRAT